MSTTRKKNVLQHSCKGNTPANAWSVVPPMWQAAAPALAVIKVLWGGNIVIKRFKRYDLPVLALSVKNTLSSSYGVYHCHLFRYKIHLKRTQRAETSSGCSAVFVVATIRIALKCLSLKLAQSKQNGISSNRSDETRSFENISPLPDKDFTVGCKIRVML